MVAEAAARHEALLSPAVRSAFVAEVEAKSGSGGLTPALAQSWIERANAIRDSLHCG